MIKPDIPLNEEDRLAELLSYEILDTPPESPFDELTQLASKICGTKVSLISLIDSSRQWFKSKVGFEVTETIRDFSWCAHAILGDDILEIQDSTLDKRFADNPLLLNHPHVRFYAGAPLITKAGFKIGTLCVIDSSPKVLSQDQREALKTLSKQVVHLIEARMKEKRLCRIEIAFECEKKLNLQQAKLASIGQLSAGVGHEINNPLAIIKGYLFLVDQELMKLGAPGRQAHEMIEKVSTALLRIQEIVQRLRTFSRSEAEALTTFDLREALEETIDLFAAIYKKEGIRIETEIDSSERTPVFGNRGKINQVLVNLISNAKDATDGQEVRVIKLTLKRCADVARLEVLDNGKGIPEMIRDKIFEPFFTTKDSTQGTGIGLAIVKSILGEHGGKIFYHQPDTGTEFTVELPLSSPNLEERSSLAQRPPEKGQTIKLKILVIDDERDLRTVLSQLLLSLGHEVDIASDGKEALKMIFEIPYDLILSDLQMPGMDGNVLARLVRNNKSIPQPKFIFMSGATSGQSTETGEARIEKPFDLDELRDTISSVFSQ